MKKLLKKSLAVILTALLLISTVPITVSAAEATADSVGKVFNDNRTRSDDSRAVYIKATFSNGKTWRGSGFIFARNAVMTAAHLVYEKYCGGIAEYITVYPEDQMVRVIVLQILHTIRQLSEQAKKMGTGAMIMGLGYFKNEQ